MKLNPMPKQIIFIFLMVITTYPFMGVGQDVNFTPTEQQWIDDHQTINFGYEPNWEPYEIYDNGEYTGIVGDYVKIIESKTGIDMVPIPNITWEESLAGLKDGTINVVPCCAITEERKTFLDFTDIYIKDPIIIATRNDYKYISCIEDLNGKTVALPKSYYSIELIKKDHPNIEIIEKQSVQACLDELSFGNVDAFIGNLGVVTYNINNRGYDNLKIAAPTEYKKNGIAFAVTKDWSIFKDIVQKVFNSINQKEKSELKNNWISVKYDYGINPKTFFKWIGGIILIFSVILLIFYFWNKSLQKQINLRMETEEKLNHTLIQVKKQSNEKETLLQEIHHRVKNNLQIITSLLRLQASTTKDDNVITSLNHATERIRTISLIHEKIYSSKNLGDIKIKDYTLSLGQEVIKSMSDETIKLEVKSTIDTLNLKSIVPLALILNELLTNSIKYGLKNQKDGEISIEFTQTDVIKLVYFDNGTWVTNEESDFFGTTLIEVFTEQLEGNYKLNKTKTGTEYIFHFKEIQ